MKGRARREAGEVGQRPETGGVQTRRASRDRAREVWRRLGLGRVLRASYKTRWTPESTTQTGQSSAGTQPATQAATQASTQPSKISNADIKPYLALIERHEGRGKPSDNIYVVDTEWSGGGSGVFVDLLLFVRFTQDKALENGQWRDRIQVILCGLHKLGDRDESPSKLQKDHVIIKKNDGGEYAIKVEFGGAETPYKTEWFRFKGGPINPACVYLLCDECSTVLPQCAAIDLQGCINSNQYNGPMIEEKGWYKSTDKNLLDDREFKYRYLGESSDHVHVVEAVSSGGGSELFRGLFVRSIYPG